MYRMSSTNFDKYCQNVYLISSFRMRIFSRFVDFSLTVSVFQGSSQGGS